MANGNTLRDLFRHMAWADAVVWTAVHHLGADDKRLRDLLSHLHLTQRAFLDVWTAKSFDGGSRKEPTFAEVEVIGRAYHRDSAEFMDTLDDASLDQPMNLPWAQRFIKGASGTTLGETMLQITSHSTYHRGQANMRIRELGADPPLVDFIAWLWLGRPDARWLV